MVNLVPSPKTATSVSSGRFGRASGVASGGTGAGAVWANTAPRLAKASKQTTFIGMVLAYHGARGGSAVGKPGTASQFQRRELVAVPALRRAHRSAFSRESRVCGFTLLRCGHR